MAKKIKKLFSEKDNMKVKSVPTRSAQSEASCDAAFNKELQELSNRVETFLNKNENKMLVFIVGLLYCYGLRVGEVLSISKENLLGNNLIYIKGSKGSDDRIVSVVYAQEIYASFAFNNYPLSTVYSRFWLYRELRKYGLYSYFGDNKHASVTHMSRHLKVLSLKQAKVKDSVIQKFIGHKSIKTLRYYEKEIK